MAGSWPRRLCLAIWPGELNIGSMIAASPSDGSPVLPAAAQAAKRAARTVRGNGMFHASIRYGLDSHRGTKPLESVPHSTCWRLLFVEEGGLRIEQGERTDHLQGPQGWLTGPGDQVGWFAAAAGTWWMFAFIIEERATLLREPAPPLLPLADGLPRGLLAPSQTTSLGRLLREIAVRWWRDPLDHVRANLQLTQWLLDRCAADEVPANESQRLRRLAEDHLHAGINASDLARLVGVSPATLDRMCRRWFGQPPGNWLAGLCLDRACRLLCDPARRVNDIASLCGYRSASAFSSAVRRHTGHAPREWRRQLLCKVDELPTV